jgi:hypothetical protein
MDFRIEDNVVYCNGFKLFELKAGEFDTNQILSINIEGMKRVFKWNPKKIELENIGK